MQREVRDSDENLLKESLADLDTKCFFSETLSYYFQITNHKDFSILHLNIRSLQKHFDDFKGFSSHLNFTFKVICLSETWLYDAKHAANFILSNYQIINLHQQNGRIGRGVYIFIHESVDFKERKNLSSSNNDREILSIEITDKTKTSCLVQFIGQLKNTLKLIFDNICRNNKDLFLVGDFNINVLDYENSAKVKKFVNFAFRNSLIPLINNPTRITRRNATTIDHISTNAFLNKRFETRIIKTEISDHFPIFTSTDRITSGEIKNRRTLLYKRTANTATRKNFKSILVRKN